MFDRQKVPPKTSPSNPTRGTSFSIAFTNANRKWTEAVDLLGCLSEVLKKGGHSNSVYKSWVELDSGLILQPGIVSFQPLQKEGIRTVTTIEVGDGNRIPDGVFEFQHATGNDTRDSIINGFEGWMKVDLPVFLDALRDKPEQCAFMQIDSPAKGDAPARRRRVVLGPVSHMVTRPQNEPEEHPFCPCCLFTNTAMVSKEKVMDDRFYGIRLFAMRDEKGAAAADCRVNGEEWEGGKAALREYVKSWPDRGVEFRKQYIIIQSQPTAAG
jgi:hypothetical protein